LTEKTPRSDLESDEFISLGQRAIVWIKAQKVPLIIGTVALLLVVFGLMGLRWYRQNREMAASKAFVAARQILNARVVERAGAEETTQADGTFSSEQDKYRAALAEFDKVSGNFSGTGVALLARYFAAECHRLLGEHDKAKELFDQYLAEAGPEGELSAFAIEGLGALLEEQNKIEDARAQYRRLTEPPFEFARDRGLYHMARLTQKSGDLAEAARMFAEILEKHPKTMFAQEINGRLSQLPKPPASEKPTAPQGGDTANPSAAAANPK